MTPEQHADQRDPGGRGRNLDVFKLEVDKDGALVTLEPGSWFVCFVPGLQKQWRHPFVNRIHKHMFALRPEKPGEWTLFEPWWHRLLNATVSSEQAKKFLFWGAAGDVLLVREAIPGAGDAEAVLHALWTGPRRGMVEERERCGTWPGGALLLVFYRNFIGGLELIRRKLRAPRVATFGANAARCPVHGGEPQSNTWRQSGRIRLYR